jgi:hypothetical protein
LFNKDDYTTGPVCWQNIPVTDCVNVGKEANRNTQFVCGQCDGMQVNDKDVCPTETEMNENTAANEACSAKHSCDKITEACAFFADGSFNAVAWGGSVAYVLGGINAHGARLCTMDSAINPRL